MHVYEHNDLQMTSLFIVFDKGSLYETKGREGTMHLMEHLICKTFDDLLDELQQKGIEDNAYTCDEYVVVWFKGLESKLTPIKEKLVKRIIGGLNITEEQFLQERKVVVEEYLDFFNSQILGNYFNALRNYYGYFGAIGLRSSIENFTYENAKQTYEENFKCPVRIVEVGPTKSNFSFVKYAKKATCSLKDMNFVETEQESVNVNNKLSVIGLGKNKCPINDFAAFNLGTLMLGGGLNSPLYKEIREKRGLSYFSWCEAEEYGTSSILMLGSCTEKNRINELTDTYNDILYDINKYLTKERFIQCKDQELTELEIEKILRYRKPTDLIVQDGLYKYRNLESISYNQVIETMNKYVNQESVKFIIG